MPFQCQSASTFPPKIHPNLFKNRSWKASIFRSLCASIFYRFWLDFGSQLGAMLATFSSKMVRPCGTLPPFFFDSPSILEANLEPCWPHFLPKWGKSVVLPPFFVGSMLLFDFWAVLAASWPHFGSILEANLEPCWPPFRPKSRAKRASTPAQSDQDRQEPQKPRKLPQKPMGYPSGPRPWSQHGCI